ncbi:restriction endonuclease subunit S [Bacillus sp. FSL M7-0996]|uniref:restriction endonuclease subunit S n=1 Tax=Bacillus sp. FSL M7-0996 TaxID=2921538 RepID=UPI0030F69E56
MITLLERFDTIFDTPESVQKLQELILDMAVQGKLVQQDPNDEPASVLLESAKAEREQLVKEKKIKKESVLPLITVDEEPYRLPKGWKWGRLGDLGNIFSGNSINAKIKEARYSKVTQGYDYIATKDIDSQTREIKYENGIKIPFHEDKFKVAHEGSVLICAEGGSAGKKIGILSKDVCFGNKLIVTETYGEINNKYIFFLYQSSLFYKSFSSRMTGIIGGISIGKFKEIPVPIPPVLEQKRIVEKIEQLLNFCRKLKEQLENKQTKEDKLNISAFVSLEQSETEEELRENLQFVLSHLHSLCKDTKHIKQLRNGILSLAVKGKLVLQDERDEPASLFLDKIKVKREQLIKEKKIKKEKILPQITDEEKPFNLPKGWEWARLGDITVILRGSSPRPKGDPKFFTETQTPFHWITIWDITHNSEGDKLINTREFLTELGSKKSTFVQKGEIIVAISGSTVGKNSIVDIDGYIYDGLAVIKEIFNDDLRDYLKVYLEEYKVKLNNMSEGTAFPNINTGTLKNLIIPIPPLNEIKRILSKVRSIMMLLDKLEQTVQQSKEESQKLMTAVLQETFTIKEEVLS